MTFASRVELINNFQCQLHAHLSQECIFKFVKSIRAHNGAGRERDFRDSERDRNAGHVNNLHRFSINASFTALLRTGTNATQ
jgi:hypothetical protein